jgi:hypothetical protein
MTYPVQQHTTLRHLLKYLVAQPGLRELERVTQQQVFNAITLPVATALWIAKSQPALAEEPHLNLVIAGAERGPEDLDDGKWFQLIPLLLGKPQQTITVTLVGPHVNGTTRHLMPLPEIATRTGAELPSNWAPAKKVTGTLGEFWRDSPTKANVVVLPHPGVEDHHQSWLQEDELPRVLRSDTPVGAFSYSLDEYEAESWLLAQYGLTPNLTHHINPYAPLEPRAPIPLATAHVLWSLPATLPDALPLPDTNAIHYADSLINASYTEWLNNGFGFEYARLGKTAFVSDDEDWIFVLPYHAINVKTGALAMRQEQARSATPSPRVTPAMLKGYPGRGALPYLKKLWALEISKVLAPNLTT